MAIRPYSLLLFIQRTYIAFRQSLRSCLQHAAHDFAGACLRQFIYELHIFGPRNRSHVSRHVLAQFFCQFRRGSKT